MHTSSGISLALGFLAALLGLATTGASAASLEFTSHTACKARHVIADRQPAAGVIFGLCVVDIRPGNLRAYLMERARSGGGNAGMLPYFRGSARSQLTLTPDFTSDTVRAASTSTSNASPGGLVEELRQPFDELTAAMMTFTGQPDVGLTFPDTPPWEGLPDVNGSRLMTHSSVSTQSFSSIPQAVIPLPGAGLLLLGGLFALGAVAVRRR